MANKEDYNQEEEHVDQEGLFGEKEQENVSVEDTIGDDLNEKLEEANDRYARLLAEFDNYKKRTSRERVDIIQSAGKEVIGKLLPVIDDFDRALVAMENTQDIASVREGIELVNAKLRKTLEQQGLKEMEVIGEPFDSEFQEAITTIPAPSDELKNKVIDVVEKGYLLNDKVIRFAKVVIGQ